ncbi:MAG: hypothetical protein BGO41_07885 [Clostridiales bacterium 38-18]|nr:MAG: hypothetical protein BGO41_07885 [Clostridiales bacterium 38-18]
MLFKNKKNNTLDLPVLTVMSLADRVAGQGVGSAFTEQFNLVNEKLNKMMTIKLNTFGSGNVIHYHSINFRFFLHALLHRQSIKVGSVHFIPETIDGSIKLPKWMQTIFYWYILKFYETMDQLVTVNPVFIDKLVDLGFESSTITYIPNFVSREQFHMLDVETKNRVKNEHQIKKDAKVILGVGQIQTRKGILDFVEVAKQLPNIEFVWAGGFSFGKITDGFEALNDVVSNPPKNVHFIGIVDRDKMNEIYNMADVMFLPSYSELFPMTVLESMNVGLPLVLRDLELYEDILFDYYLKAEDNPTFVKIIKRLTEDADYYNQVQKQSVNGSEFYCRESVGKMWETYYAKMIQLESSDQYGKKYKAYN